MGLHLGHEAAEPGGRVFDEGAQIGAALLVRVADGVGDAGIGHAAYGIDLDVVAGRDARAVFVADGLGIASFVVGGGISEIDPEERADLHGLLGGLELRDGFGVDQHDLGGTEVAHELVVEVRIGGGLHGDGHRAGPLRDGDGGAAVAIACGVDLAVRHDEHGAGTLDAVHGVGNAVLDGLLGVDERGDDFGRVVLAVAVLGEVDVVLLDGLPGQLLDVVELADGHDAVHAEVGRDQERLVVHVADDADAALRAAEPFQVGSELGPEHLVGDVVDGTDDGTVGIGDGHAAADRAQMRMIVDPVEEVVHAVTVRDNAEKTAHSELLLKFGLGKMQCYNIA